MNLFIFRTNIETEEKVDTVKPFLNNHTNILKWSIDIEDVDNVLKVKSEENLKEDDVIKEISTHGFNCVILDY